MYQYEIILRYLRIRIVPIVSNLKTNYILPIVPFSILYRSITENGEMVLIFFYFKGSNQNQQ